MRVPKLRALLNRKPIALSDDGGSSFVQVIMLWRSEVHRRDVSGANPLLENVESGFAQQVSWCEDLARVLVVVDQPVVLGDEEGVAGCRLVCWWRCGWRDRDGHRVCECRGACCKLESDAVAASVPVYVVLVVVR